jgi:hypothetical protein
MSAQDGKDPEMGCRGVHFALIPDETARLESARDDDELMAVIEEIEDRWDRDWLVETDKAWGAVGGHALQEGKAGNLENPSTPGAEHPSSLNSPDLSTEVPGYS